MRVLWAIACLACLPVARLEAKPLPIKEIFVVKGKCDKLVLSGRTLTPKCKGILQNASLPDTRTQFYFSTTDGASLVFSGLGKKQVSHGANALQLPVDRTNFILQGKPDRPTPAKGQCDFENPAAGVAHILCKADGATGHFEGSFVTDGKPPVVGRLKQK